MAGMGIVGVGKRVRIYMGESDQWQARPLYLAILETPRSEGCAGATVVRGIASFGANSRIHTATILRLSEDLPIVIEWIDSLQRVERVLPRVKEMVASGMITLDGVEVVHYQHRPVVDHQNHLVGLVADTELIEQGGLGLRVESLGTLTLEALEEQSEAVEEAKIVADVMVRDVVTTMLDATLSDAAHLMVTRNVKRLPVVDSAGVLVGMISRADLLRTATEGYMPVAPTSPTRMGRTVGEVMRTDVPRLAPEAPLPEVLDAVISTPLSRAFVVDEDGRFIGLVSDAELIRRLSPQDRPSAMRILMGRLPFSTLPPEERRNLERAAGSRAEDLMVTGIPAVSPETTVAEAIRILVTERRRLIVVVDEDGRLLGAVHQ